MNKKAPGLITVLAFASIASPAAPLVEDARVDTIARTLEPKVIEWRRDFHLHPELSNREFRTAKLVAEHLKKLGLEVETGIAHTGVVALLKGGKPGPTIALRADMDALPVTEKTDVPFKSRATATYRDETVGVMHACGHDVHTSVLMGAAQALVQMRDALPGNVLFIFQPAEEGAPAGEEGGASLMLKEGLFDKYRPQVVFGMHTRSVLHTGVIGVRSGPVMAASDAWRVIVKGKQAHGSTPWQGVDPIVVSAQIINALQTVVSRQVDITAIPAVVTVGAIKGGIRHNIIPESVEMIGTIRTFDVQQREKLIAGMQRIIENTAAASGATATFAIEPGSNPVVVNNPELTARMLPTFRRIAGAQRVKELELITGAEDFAYFANTVPSLFFFLGITPPDQNPLQAPSHHSDYFYVDEKSIGLGLRTMIAVALDYLGAAAPSSAAK